MSFHVVTTGMGSAPEILFEHKIKTYGGSVEQNMTSETTHIIVDEKIDLEKLVRLAIKTKKFGTDSHRTGMESRRRRCVNRR